MGEIIGFQRKGGEAAEGNEQCANEHVFQQVNLQPPPTPTGSSIIASSCNNTTLPPNLSCPIQPPFPTLLVIFITDFSTLLISRISSQARAAHTSVHHPCHSHHLTNCCHPL
ncbi:hypothetical protein AMECASPLE_033466 [Ameca splendens]|uniref:Uncharacterized protein n=1 Tax=Ameca splendens TaxID=208324 RepID=A0ABV0YUE5_9TELE